MKKSVIVFILGVLVLLAGCRTQQDQDTLVLALREGAYANVVKMCLPEFEHEYGIRCKVVEMSEEALHTNILNDSVNRTGEYDLCMVDSSWMAEFTSEKVLTDLGALGYSFDDDIIPETTSICVQQEKLYLTPYLGNVSVMMYNLDAARQLGYGKDSFESLEDMRDFLDAATEAGYGGFGYRGDTDSNLVADFLPILCAYGGWVVDENNEPTVDTPEFAAAMEFYLELIRKGSAHPREELMSCVADGSVVAAVGWPAWYSPDLSEHARYMTFPAKATRSSESYNSSIYGIWTLGIPANSAKAETSVKLLKYLMDKDVQKSTVSSGGVPCRYSSLKDLHLILADPHIKVICKALENGVYRPGTQEWPRFCSILADNMRLIMSGTVSVKDGLSLAQEALEALHRRQ